MYEQDTSHHRAYVTDKDGVRSLRFEHNRQSSMYLDDPFETDIEYCGYLHLPLAVQPKAERVLVIGLGGGTVVKRMWRDYPRVRIDAVELDPEIVEIARVLFALPEDPRIRVSVGDGRAFLEASDETWDVIVVDAFDDDAIPRPLLTEEFMRECRDHLAPGGAIAWNVIGTVTGDYSKPFRCLYRTASNVWPRVWPFALGHSDSMPDSVHNVIVLATSADLTTGALECRIADRVGGMVTVRGFARFGEDLYRGPVRTGDVPILTDPHRGTPTRRSRP
jgi:spermidine synthase